jgi:hypothetical protein
LPRAKAKAKAEAEAEVEVEVEAEAEVILSAIGGIFSTTSLTDRYGTSSLQKRKFF